MYKFGNRSNNELRTIDPRLQRVYMQAIKIFDFAITEGHRTIERQEELFAKGFSKVKNGKHNFFPSLAGDTIPYPQPNLELSEENKLNEKQKTYMKELHRYYYMQGIFRGISHMMDLPTRNGCDWDSDGKFLDQTFDDCGHTEIK